MSSQPKKNATSAHPLSGRRMYIPRMSTGAAEAMAAAFRSVGVDASVSPESDETTMALASRYTTGEECLPQRVVLGNFLKVVQAEGFDASQYGFLLPTAAGPCRYGQYAPLLRKILTEMGHGDALVFSPTSSDGYGGIAENAKLFILTAWRAIVVSDILRKLLYIYRPYEQVKGDTDRVHDEALQVVCRIFEDGSLSLRRQKRHLVGALEEARDVFVQIYLSEALGSRPVIGAVGEIYLRFNSFSNQQIVRRIEALGGEVWIANIAEWVFYTNSEERRRLRESNRRFSVKMAGSKIREWIQLNDEHAFLKPVEHLFKHRPDVHVDKILEYSRPYLPQDKALGEMTLNSGNAIAYYHAGCDGVVDISPFTCMNGIVTEVVYPTISRDHGGMPIRIFYFDGVPFDLDGDLEIFMEQVKSYRRKRLSRTADC